MDFVSQPPLCLWLLALFNHLAYTFYLCCLSSQGLQIICPSSSFYVLCQLKYLGTRNSASLSDCFGNSSIITSIINSNNYKCCICICNTTDKILFNILPSSLAKLPTSYIIPFNPPFTTITTSMFLYSAQNQQYKIKKVH